MFFQCNITICVCCRRAKRSPWCRLPMFWGRVIHTEASAGSPPTLKIRALKKVTQVRNNTNVTHFTFRQQECISSNVCRTYLFSCHPLQQKSPVTQKLRNTRNLAHSPPRWLLQVLSFICFTFLSG